MSEEQNKVCPQCGATREEDAMFCGECGFKFEELTNEEPKQELVKDDNSSVNAQNLNDCTDTTPSTRTCPKCGNVVPQDSDFCNKCGTNLSEQLYCSNCGFEYNLGDAFCPKCGTNLTNNQNNTQNIINQPVQPQVLRCQRCGTPYTQGEKFCASCGANLLGYETNQPVQINQTISNQIQNDGPYRCPYCGSGIKSKNIRKCPHCGEWLKVSHFGCGSLLVVLTAVLCFFFGSAFQSIELPLIGAVGGGIIFLIVFIDLLPSIIAEARGHESKTAIFVVNLFFGWLIIPWIICLVWSLTGRSR